MFYEHLVDIGDFNHAINSLYNNLEDHFGTSEEKYLYTKKHLGISYMYFFTNINNIDNLDHWFDIYDKNQPIKEIDNNTNTLELIDKSLGIIINTFKKGINYLPNIYEINKGKEYLNIFSLLDMKHSRIEINKDLMEEINNASTRGTYEILLRHENKKNIHKDIRYLIKKHNFETVDLTIEVLHLIL